MKAGEERKSKEFPLFYSAAMYKILMFLITLETDVWVFLALSGNQVTQKREVAQLLAQKKVALWAQPRQEQKLVATPPARRTCLFQSITYCKSCHWQLPPSRWLLFRLFCLCVSCFLSGQEDVEPWHWFFCAAIKTRKLLCFWSYRLVCFLIPCRSYQNLHLFFIYADACVFIRSFPVFFLGS